MAKDKLSAVTFGAAVAYVKASLVGIGALKGSPCEIQSITPITGGNRVTFAWTDTNNVTHTDTMDVMDGADGIDGISITDLEVTATNHLIITLSDGSTVDAGEIGTVQGDEGRGIVSIEKTSTLGLVDTYTITYSDDTTSTFDVNNGERGIGITSVEKTSTTDLVDTYTITFSDGNTTTYDVKNGFSPTIEVKTSTATTYVLTITTEEGSFDTPNLKGSGSDVGSLADLDDVVLTNPQNGQIIKFNRVTNKWENADGIEIEALGDINDVVLTNLREGQIIKWDGEAWVNADAVNPTQFTTMPEASEYPTKVIQFVGTTTANYKCGYFYKSTPQIISGEVVYSWVQLDTQPSNADYEDLANKPLVNGVELLGDKTSEDIGVSDKFQYSVMPVADASTRGKIYQYTGATNADFKRGYWYICVYDGNTDTFSWNEKDVSSNPDIISRVSTLETNQGDMSLLEIATATDLVDALNKVNAKGQIDRYEYVEPYLIIYYHDGHTFQVSVGTILNDLQIGELANVIDETIADGNILQYDSSIAKYKPYAILTALQNLLQTAKDYTDEEIIKAIQVGAYVCDEKPLYDAENDTVIYKQNGEIKTTTNTSARFYYTTSEGNFFTSWIEDTEFTSTVDAVNFDDYVNKNTDVTDTYTEDMVDKTKIPNVEALDDLVAIIKTALALKVNTADIVDNLTSVDATKPLSAKQGKVLNDNIAEKNDKFQYATMPVPDEDILGKIVEYTGTTSAMYENGQFYKCVSDGEATPTYSWEKLPFSTPIDNALDDTSPNPVANSALTPEIQSRLKQYTTMPTPSIDYVGEIVQYKGTTTSTYTNGTFYECVLVDSDYIWRAINISIKNTILKFTTVNQLKTANISIPNESPIYIQENDCYYAITSRQVGDTEDDCIFVSDTQKIVPSPVLSRRIPITMFGGKSGVNSSANSALLVKAINYMMGKNSRLYVPGGEFIIKTPITITSRLNIVGDNNSTDPFYLTGSKIVFAPESNDQTLFYDGGTMKYVTIENIAFQCNYTTCTTPSSWEPVQETPHEYISWSYTYTDVNCLNLYASSHWLRNVSISGFSGYGVRFGKNQRVDNVSITKCKYGSYDSNTDVLWRDCYISNCEYGIYGSSNVSGILQFVYNTWFDQCGYAFYSVNSLAGQFTGIIDHCLYAAFRAETVSGSTQINGRINRCGMYYLGTDMLTKVPTVYSAEAFEDMSKGVYFAFRYTNGLCIDSSTSMRKNSDSGSGEADMPSLMCYGYRWRNTTVRTAENLGERTIVLNQKNSNVRIFNNDVENVKQMPTADVNNLDRSVLYTGTTTSTYTKGGIYECQEVLPSTDPATYHWVLISSSGDTNIFNGTVDEYEALSSDEQKKYSHIATEEEASVTPSFTGTVELVVESYVTTGSTSLSFTVPFKVALENITTFSAVGRHVEGGYIDSATQDSINLLSSTYSLSVVSSSDYCTTFTCTKSGGFKKGATSDNVLNNTPISLRLRIVAI